MKLQNIVPWGRTLKEYQEMFLLTKEDLQQKILGCGDGPASFNLEARALGAEVVSIDPTYEFSKEQLEQRIDEVADEVIAQVRENQEAFVWKNIKDVDDLYVTRMGAMRQFLEDYTEGKEQGYYQLQMLPELSFDDKQFDLALSSHFLFLYSEHLDYEFHKRAILEMLRVAKEVRIFPLLTLENEKSPYVEKIMKELELMGFKTQIVKTNYEFQQGANEMLLVYDNKEKYEI
jgi:hypothetical protein